MSNSEKHIVVIEDDHTLSLAISVFLTKEGYRVSSYQSVEEAIKVLANHVDVILSDVMMPGATGYELLKFVKQRFDRVPVILMTAYGSIEKAVEAMKNGAYDLLVKPFSLSLLAQSIRAALLDSQTYAPPLSLEAAISEQAPTRVGFKRLSENFITGDPKTIEIIESIKRIAASKATVLIQGESGTGKELLAHMIHDFSPRKDRIFVAINCAAMPDSLLESELFGHEKGAFTGAVSRQIGKFELSNNGTILLDEISEMSLNMQTKLLRVLQECEIYRVGGVKAIPLNIRVIATTNRDLYRYMKQGNFREDLFYRLNVIPITTLPLRERGEDMMMLAKEFLQQFAILHGREELEITKEAQALIMSYDWPGNVRELRNTMERAILVGDFEVINENRVTTVMKSNGGGELGYLEGNMTLADIERDVILKTLNKYRGNRTKTAQQLGISLRTLRNKLKIYELDQVSGVN